VGKPAKLVAPNVGNMMRSPETVT